MYAEPMFNAAKLIINFVSYNGFLFKNLTERDPAIPDQILFFRIEESIFTLSTRASLSNEPR